MDALKSELTCPVCEKVFNRPVTLACYHSVCQDCLPVLFNLSSNLNEKRDYSENEKNDSEKVFDAVLDCADSIFCLMCNDKVSLPQSSVATRGHLQLPTNRLLQNIVERYKTALDESEVKGSDGFHEANGGCDEVKGERSLTCDMCEDERTPRDATKFCMECRVLYCDQCFAQCHRMKGPFASHTITTPSVSRKSSVTAMGEDKSKSSLFGPATEVLNCEVHNDEKTNMYCIGCEQLICALCKLVGTHKEHEVNDLATSYKLKQTLLGEKCEQLAQVSESLVSTMEKLKSVHTQFKDSKEDTEKLIMEEMDQLQKLLEERRKWMLAHLSQFYSQKLQSLEDEASQIKSRLSNTHSLLSFTAEALKETDPIAFLQFSTRLCDRVNDACEKALQLSELSSELDSGAAQGDHLCVDFSLDKRNISNIGFLQAPDAVNVEPELCVCKPTALKIRWASSSQVPVSEYHVVYRMYEDEESGQAWTSMPALVVEDKEDVGDTCEVVIRDLQSDTLYEVCVYAVNMAGQSPDPESPLCLRTALPIPKVPEVDVDDCVVEKNQIFFKWKSALDVSMNSSRDNSNAIQQTLAPNASMVTFVVEYRQEGEGEERDTWTIKRLMDKTEVTLRDLYYNTMYVVRVKAVSATGSSEYSPELLFTTWPLPPETPKILKEHCQGQGNKYQIQWHTQGDSRENPAESYTIEYRPTNQGKDWVTVESVQMTHCHLKDLKYDTEYSVRVRAVNVSGESDYSDCILVTTGSPPIQFVPDVNTAHVNLKISGCIVAYDRGGAKSRTPAENGFIGASFSVLGDKCVNKGKHYWEVKIKPKSTDRIGIAYGSTTRDSLIGDSDKSWAVGFQPSEDGKLFCFHNKKKKKLTFDLPSPLKSVTIGTLLDMDENFVAFFITEFNQHLHSFKVNFSEPVYPAFTVWPADITVCSGLQVPDSLLL